MNDDRNIRTYRETDLQTMGKEKLIVLLYQKMIEHFAAAAAAAGTDRPEMSRRLGLAQRIVIELRGALDHAVGGEIADNLASIYDYVFHEILQMQLNQESIHAENCQRALQPLLDAWSHITPGTGDRELHTRSQAGTGPANVESKTESPEGPGGQHLVFISA